MTPDEMRTLRRSLAVTGEAPRRFFYCPEGSDGYPLLLVGRRLAPQALLDAQRWSRSPIFVRGAVARSGEALVFVPDDARHSALLAQDLAGFFAENLSGAPPLRMQLAP